MKRLNFLAPDHTSNTASFQEEVDRLKKSIASLSAKYNFETTTKSVDHKFLKKLAKFKSLQPYDAVFYIQGLAIQGTNSSAFLTVLSINSTYIRTGSKSLRKESLTEWEFVGLANLPVDMGEVYIRPETLGDKITELFEPVEVDFESDKEFSKRYYVLTKDEEKLREAVWPNFLSAIKKHRGLEIEIHGRDLMLRLKKPLSRESAGIISEVLVELTK